MALCGRPTPNRSNDTVEFHAVSPHFVPSESHGGLHANWRKSYIRWAEFWASKDPEKRTSDIQGLMVRSWLARVSHIIQLEQYKQYEYLLTCASNFKHGNVPHLLRTAIPEDFECALAAFPPLEV